MEYDCKFILKFQFLCKSSKPYLERHKDSENKGAEKKVGLCEEKSLSGNETLLFLSLSQKICKNR
jgi:hypothetical protein